MGCNKGSSKRKFITIQVYLRKQEKSQINNLTPKKNWEIRMNKTQS